MNFKYAVFDMDGTLIDTNGLWDRCERIAVGEFCGLNLVEGSDSEFIYSGLSDMIKMASKKTGKAITFEDVLPKTYSLMCDCYNSGNIKPIDYAVQFLSFLKENGIKTAIATATDFDYCKNCLKHLGILDFVDAFVSTSMVGKSKNYPDVFNKATQMIGADKSNTMVFEDAQYALKTLLSSGFRYTIIADVERPSCLSDEVRNNAEHYIYSYKELMQ